MTAADPSWFYSSLSQVTAAVVGFLGGFLILRVLAQMSEWKDMKVRLVSLQSAWVVADQAVQTSETHRGNVAFSERAEESRLRSDLFRAIEERASAEMPPEYLRGAAALVALIGVGIIWPLITLGSPDNWEQLYFLGPWTLLLIIFMAYGARQARAALTDLKSLPLWERVEGQYEDHLLQLEAWEERRRVEQGND
jgi:hypothetical protein